MNCEAKNASAEGRIPPQELEVGPRSWSYLLVLSLKIKSSVGLLTKLRWEWLKLDFFPNFIERGVKKESDWDKGGGGF